MRLRLLAEDESTGAANPAACVEISFDLVHRDDAVFFPKPWRITPADLIRLVVEIDLTLGEIRAEVMRAEVTLKRALGDWYAEGGAAIASMPPNDALLARVLHGLSKDDLTARRDTAGPLPSQRHPMAATS
ncbi:hypothetical protein [Streptomyces silvisoli]|uniref:Uncharacterized protein n=1 Tax=Streptomyces silvisoli TaxID=3034235 RepID=A0ABT5ZQ19_9ACTN|nr:hypothetical protein [Streptomyces silvisoli]MDF3291917.1 hypothetical protein [Streptomyces silvisoli]